jgi:hypothetical protein
LIRAVSEAAVATDGPAAKAATVMLAMSDDLIMLMMMGLTRSSVEHPRV